MNKEQQRIAIAEWAGYKWPGLREDKDIIGWQLNGQYIPRLPDYPNDLNAIHEVEALVISKLSRALRYEETLVDVCSNSHPPGTEMGSLWHATAAQRSEALLRTLGLWREDK